MNKDTIHKYTSEMIYCLIAAILSILAAFIFLGFYAIDWQVPITYGRDAFGALTAAQNFITGGGRFLYSNMGAPGVVNIYNIPDICNIEYLMMWILSLFIKQSGLLVNVFYLLTIPAISVCTVISMRVLKISPKVSILGGIIYSLLPYSIYRGESHLFLATYAFIPLSCVICLWTIRGELKFNKYRKIPEQKIKSMLSIFNKKMIFSIVTCILVGASNIYYTFFICMIMVFAMIWSVVEGNSIRKVVAPIFLLVVIGMVTLVGLIPYATSILQNTTPALEGTRQARDVEVYGLKLPQLILPIEGHRIPLLAKVREHYENVISINSNENKGATLGILMSIGFIASFIIVLRNNNKLKNKKNNIIRECALLNVCIFLLGATGGISSFVAFIVSSFRCYNRLCVFIAFFSLVIVSIYIDEWVEKVKIQWIKAALLVIIGIISLLDTTSPQNNVAKQQNLGLYYSNKNFVESIEKTATKDAKIFQLPFMESNNNAGLNKMGPYEQFYPFVHSKTLKWSYRAQLGSEAEKWQKYISSQPTSELLKYLAAADFEDIYIDRFGYKDNDWQKVEQEIEQLTGVAPIVSENNRMSYFELKDYIKKLKNEFNEEEMKKYNNYGNVVPIVLENQKMDVSNLFGGTLLSGWSNVESWGVWSDGNNAQMELGFLNNSHDLIMEADIITQPNPIDLDININGTQIKDYILQNGKLIIPIKKQFLEEKKNKVFEINLELQIKNPAIPENGDTRLLGIGLKNYTIRSAK